MSKTYNYCNNCGNVNHTFNYCKYPITSIGLISFKRCNQTDIKYLMICRKDSLGYIEFMRGKYPLYNINYIKNIIDEMTIEEKNNIQTTDFKTLWDKLWGENVNLQYKKEEKVSYEKYKKLKEGIIVGRKIYTLDNLLKESETKWTEPEWGFPKGRRNYRENDLTCAIREFNEETGINIKDVNIVTNLNPFDEIFTGSNLKSYKHRYFIGEYTKEINNVTLNDCDETEVSNMKWLSLNECLEHIRPYNIEKKELIQNIEFVIKHFKFKS